MQGVELTLQRGDMGGVLITEAAGIQGVYYKHVFLLGVREGEFPSLKTENWIYNDNERATMVSLGIDLPGTIAGLNEDRYFLPLLLLPHCKALQSAGTAMTAAVLPPMRKCCKTLLPVIR